MSVTLTTTNLFDALRLLLADIMFIVAAAVFIFSKNRQHKLDCVGLMLMAIWLRML